MEKYYAPNLVKRIDALSDTESAVFALVENKKYIFVNRSDDIFYVGRAKPVRKKVMVVNSIETVEDVPSYKTSKGAASKVISILKEESDMAEQVLYNTISLMKQFIGEEKENENL